MTSKYKPYPRYKDSEIKWIGEIPVDWKINKVKYLVDKSVYYPIGDGDHGQITPDMYQNKGVPYIRVQNLSWNGEILFKGMVYISEEINLANKKSILKPQDLLIAKTGATIGKIGFMPKNINLANTTSSVGKITINKKIHSPCFWNYYFQSDIFQNQIFISAYQKSAQPGFNIEDLVDFIVTIPSLKEQFIIANFLDKKTAEIDEFIEKDKKLIGLLKEKRTALINHTVTKGLNPNANMKDSGVEWIGEIPEGWEVYKLKYKIIINKKKLEDDINPSYVINYLDISNVDSSGNILDIEEQIFEDAPSRARRIPRSGDTILSTVRTYLKAIAYLENIPSNLIVSTGFAVLEPIKSINSKYLFYSISSEVFIQNVIAYSKGVAYPAINPPELGQIPIIMPPLPEQTTIVNFLNKVTAKIDKTIQKIEQKIKFLEEYKKSLIHHAVTGKIDVREL